MVLDARARRVIGWELDRTLEDDLSLAALRMAVRSRTPAWRTIPAAGFSKPRATMTGPLKDNKILICTRRKKNPYDNAICESFIKILKYEEVYRQARFT